MLPCATQLVAEEGTHTDDGEQPSLIYGWYHQPGPAFTREASLPQACSKGRVLLFSLISS